MHEFFSFNFPLREYFFCTPPAPPPPPISFLMVCPLFTLYHAVADLGEGPGGGGGAAPQLFLDQTEARTAEFFFSFFTDRIQKRT